MSKKGFCNGNRSTGANSSFSAKIRDGKGLCSIFGWSWGGLGWSLACLGMVFSAPGAVPHRHGNKTLGVHLFVESDVEVEHTQFLHINFLHKINIQITNACFLIMAPRHGGVMTRYCSRMKATSLPLLFHPPRTLQSIENPWCLLAR